MNLKLTLEDFLVHLYQRWVTASKFEQAASQTDNWKQAKCPDAALVNGKELSHVCSILGELRDAAEFKDAELYELLDDMLYVSNETGMGAYWKAAGYLPTIHERIESLKNKA